MIAGRELDALVAEKVMGCKPERFKFSRQPSSEDFCCGCDLGNYHGESSGHLKYYSTDILVSCAGILGAY